MMYLETPLPWTSEPKAIRHHMKFLNEFAHSVSNALDFLHSHDLWHGNLRREWISISPNGMSFSAKVKSFVSFFKY